MYCLDSYPLLLQCSKRGSPSVLKVGWGRTTNRSQSSHGENFFPRLTAVGRGKTPGHTTKSQSVSECEARQIPADPHKYWQDPTDPHGCLQAKTDPHSSPPFKQRICSPPQSLIVLRSGREENNYSVILTNSRRKDKGWRNRNLGHYALFRLYLQTGVVISRLKTIWGWVFPKAVSSKSWPCSSAASMRPSLPIRYVSRRY